MKDWVNISEDEYPRVAGRYLCINRVGLMAPKDLMVIQRITARDINRKTQTWVTWFS